MTGAGTSADPFQIVTEVQLGSSGLRLVQTDSYVEGEEAYRTSIDVVNDVPAPLTAIIYRAGRLLSPELGPWLRRRRCGDRCGGRRWLGRAAGRCAWVHVSGYALRDANGGRLARELAALAPATRLSVGGGSLPPGDEAAAFVEVLRVAGPELLIFNRDEAAALGAHALGCVVVATSGRGGSTATAPSMQPIHVAAPADDRPVLDTTGAGDAYAAALIDELADLGSWPPPRAELEQAMEVASRLGADVARVEDAQGRVG